jgi:AcrR family transcriptional regulator
LPQQRRSTPKNAATLDARAVKDAALRLVRRDGVEKFSMRGLARELGVSPMALYHHVPNKDALLDQLPEANARGKSPQLRGEAEIIATALQLLRSQGAEQLSMRGLARELGVSVMALYHYVRSREELLDKVRNSLLAQVATPSVTRESWEAQMRAYALESVLLVSEYPGLVSFGALRGPTESDRRLTRHGIEILLAAGCDARTAALAIRTYHTQIFGLVILQNLTGRAPQPARRSVAPQQRTTHQPPDVAAVTRELCTISFREAVEFSIDTVLQGLRVQIEAAIRARGGRDPRRPRRTS